MNLYKFFDTIGLAVFTFLLIDALWDIQRGNRDVRTYIRLAIGVGGLLVDGYLVFFY